MAEEATHKETAEEFKQAAHNMREALKLLAAHSNLFTLDALQDTSSLTVIHLLEQHEDYYRLYDAHDNR